VPDAKHVLPWLLPGLLIALELPFVWTIPHVGEWFVFWYAGHLVATGQSPYEPASWLAATRDYGALPHGITVNTFDGWDLSRVQLDGRWLWPPLAGILLAPFGALPLDVGIPLMHVVWIAAGLASAFALVRILVPPPLRPLALAVVVVSPPLVQVMRASSVTLAILPSVVVVFAALRRKSGAWLGVAVSGLSIRIQLFAILAAALLVQLAVRRLWRVTLIAVAVWALVAIAALALSPVPLDPSLLEAARRFTEHDNVSTWRLAWAIDPDLVAPIALTLIGATALLVAIAIRNAGTARDEVLVAASLAFAVGVQPYAHMYDQLALVPAWLIALRSSALWPARARALLVAAIIVVALGYGWAGYLVGAAGMRAAGALGPLFALALLAGALSMPRRVSPAIATS
jgi:hypothetical protein